MATTADNLLDPGPDGSYPNWPRDANGVPVQPVDSVTGKPISYARSWGCLYAIFPGYAMPLESRGYTSITPPKV